jgi:endonuclease III
MSANQRQWRENLRAHIRQHPDAFPLADKYPAGRLGLLIQQETRRLERIAARLAATYETPDLGNKQNPVDELVYIILSRRTRESAYQQAYEAITSRWQSWDDVADASLPDIAATVRASGLGARKARSIKGALTEVRQQFGSYAMPVGDWRDGRVYEFLVGLPEVGPKSAYCIMAMSLDRPAFAVDAHVGRVMARLGPYASIGLDLRPLDHKKRQALLPPLIPLPIRRDLHVNVVAHGRVACRVHRPLCPDCPVLELCHFGVTS